LDVFYFGEGFAIKKRREQKLLLYYRKGKMQNKRSDCGVFACMSSHFEREEFRLAIGGDSRHHQCLPAGNGRIFFSHEFGYY
jgi:hypothetical protein